jgi:hypothetical protein
MIESMLFVCELGVSTETEKGSCVGVGAHVTDFSAIPKTPTRLVLPMLPHHHPQ